MFKPRGPFCQSCGLPITDATFLGTEKNGDKNQFYCKECYDNGIFNEPEITVKEMIKKAAKKLSGMKCSRLIIIALIKQIPHLKRWRESATSVHKN